MAPRRRDRRHWPLGFRQWASSGGGAAGVWNPPPHPPPDRPPLVGLLNFEGDCTSFLAASSNWCAYWQTPPAPCYANWLYANEAPTANTPLISAECLCRSSSFERQAAYRVLPSFPERFVDVDKKNMLMRCPADERSVGKKHGKRKDGGASPWQRLWKRVVQRRGWRKNSLAMQMESSRWLSFACSVPRKIVSTIKLGPSVLALESHSVGAEKTR